METKFVEKDNKKSKKMFIAKCLNCKDKEVMTLDNGMNYTLPYAFVEIPKDKDMLKEFKEYAEESKEKYGDERVIKRSLINGCPKCGKTITICCKDYVDFYSPKKEEKNK